jgi:hypothetical protein
MICLASISECSILSFALKKTADSSMPEKAADDVKGKAKAKKSTSSDEAVYLEDITPKVYVVACILLKFLLTQFLLTLPLGTH